MHIPHLSRYAAAAIHFALCLVMAIMLLSALWFVWYPAPLLEAVGGKEIVFMLLSIDVTLGPLLTLVVFKSGKATLKFDLAVIAVLQLLALAYGVYTLFAGRPVYIASMGNSFQVVQANDIEQQELDAAKIALPWWGPKWVGTTRPTDEKERERLLISGVAGAGLGNFPQHHAPLESMREMILAKRRPIAELRASNPVRDTEITDWLSSHGYNDQSAAYQPLRASRRMAVIFDAKTAKVIGIAPFKPWD